MADAAPRNVPALLQVRGLNVYYGHSHALQGVEFTIHTGILAVVGRNGMGKTTLCKTIMGLVRASSGSIRFANNDELTRLNPAQIARLGIGYVPQGRRLWRSLTVDEHLQVTPSARKGAWTVERIYDTFPRLAERKNNAGGQLSGGEQQMLAISRALLANPRLLVMDEPTEGLAPLIVAQVEEMLVKLAEDGEMAVLVIEQNIGVACAVSENVAIMVNGRINRVIEAHRLAADRALQQRLLGVGRHGHDDTPLVETATPEAGGAAPAARRPAGASTRIYVSNPTLPTRWSQPVPVARIEATARTSAASIVSIEEAAGRRAEVRPLAASGPPVVLVAGTLDTKGEELRYIRDLLKARRCANAPRRPVHERQALRGGCVAKRNCAQSSTWCVGRVLLGSRRIGRRDGGGVRDLDQPAERHCGCHFGRRIRGDRAGHTGHAAAPGGRAEDHDFDGGLRRSRALRRRLRHHDDVFGHRRSGPQRHLAPNSGEWRAGDCRHGEGAYCRGTRGARPRRAGRAAGHRPHDVRRHDAVRAATHRGAEGRVRLPRVPRDRHRRPVDGEAGRRRASSRASSTSRPPRCATS